MEIKALIFDLDGVLVDTSDIHLAALNKALSFVGFNYHISAQEDLTRFGTIPTKEKLKILSQSHGLSEDLHSTIYNLKKQYTIEEISNLAVSQYLPANVVDALSRLSKEYKLYLASNTNYQFIFEVLNRGQLLQYFSDILSNQSVDRHKPHPEIYLKTFLKSGLAPDECLILEDSITGQEAAIRSGAHVMGIESPYQLNYDVIKSKIANLPSKPVKWKSEKVNVLVPMAGEGSRFRDAGYTTPKPIIDVQGLPMVGLVTHKLNIDANFIFVVKGEHCQQYNLEAMLNLMHPGCTIVKAWGKQGGAACSVLEAENFIDNDNHLLIVNSDQIWDWNSRLFYHQMIKEDLDGGIVTFYDPDKNPKWSFAKTNDEGYVTEVAEKNPISHLATAGIYYFKHGSDFVKYAKQMIDKKITVNNEYYVCPVFNELCLDNKRIKTFDIERMWGLGIPEDLDFYLENHRK